MKQPRLSRAKYFFQLILFTALSHSSSVAYAATAAQIIFSTQPGGGAAGSPWKTQPTVTLKDAHGNTMTADYSTRVTLSLSSGSGALNGQVTKTVTKGVVAFSGLSMGLSGSKKLTATSGLLTATSHSFSINPGSAFELHFTTQPGTATAGSALSTQPSIGIMDSYGNTVTSDSATQITLLLNTGSTGTLNGTTVRTVSSGVATFSKLSIDLAGSKSLLAKSSNSSLGFSSSKVFQITTNPSAMLAFTTQPPTGQRPATVWTTSPVIAIQDDKGNTITSDSTTQVTLSLSSGPGTLGGTLIQTASSGLATFPNLSINQVGIKQLTASSGKLTSALSNYFSIAEETISASTSTVSASSNSIVANGTETDTITVTLLSAHHNPIVGHTVTLSSSRGSLDTISTPSGVSDSNGVVSFTVSSSTKSTSPVTFTATDTTALVRLTSVAQVNFTPEAGIRVTLN